MEKITSHMDIHNNDFKQIDVKKLMEFKMVKFTLQANINQFNDIKLVGLLGIHVAFAFIY